jgi:hypothetical protein
MSNGSQGSGVSLDATQWVSLPVTWWFRPRLAVSIDGTRCREQVAWMDAGNNPITPAIFLRLLIGNHGCARATDCNVVVTKILIEDQVLDSEPSKLAWTDRPLGTLYDPAIVMRGDFGRCYVDLCSIDGMSRDLQIMSAKREKGYHRFTAPGLYALEFQVNAAPPIVNHRGRVRFRYDREPWGELHLVDIGTLQSFWKRRLTL